MRDSSQWPLFYAAVTAMFLSRAAAAQLAGPPAGVPVPPAPIAADKPNPDVTAKIRTTDLHFRVRLLDGRDGLPLKGERIRLWYDEMVGPGYLLTTDDHGEALMPAPVIELDPEPVRTLLQPEGLFDCRKLSAREPFPGYNLKQTADKGIFTANRCEPGIRATPHPGELTLFARPLRWYERVNQP